MKIRYLPTHENHATWIFQQPRMRVFSNTLWKETPLAFSFHEPPLWSLSLPLPYSVSSIYSFERHSETAQKVNCPETILFIFSRTCFFYHVRESITAGRTVILSVKPLAFIGEAKQCHARRCQCLAKLFTLAEKHIPVFTPFGLIDGASLLLQCEALCRQTYIFIKITLHLLWNAQRQWTKANL